MMIFPFENQRVENNGNASTRLRASLPSALPALALSVVCMLAGCGTAKTVEELANMALEVTGLKKSEASLPDAQKPPRKVLIRLHAGENLNADASGRPLALVVRMYKLRQLSAFEQTRYDAFLSPQREAQALGADLLEVKEIILTPGQRLEITEKVSKEADYIGLVALFHSPAPYRWRAAFKAEEAEKAGVLLGLHACAMSAGIGAHPIGLPRQRAPFPACAAIEGSRNLQGSE